MGEGATAYRSDPPPVGQDTEEILAALGYSAEKIAALIEKGIVSATKTEGANHSTAAE